MKEKLFRGKKKRTRILRPCELKDLIDAIPKIENKERFEVLFYTGCRYTELQWLWEHPKAFDGKNIHMPSTKPKAIQSDRYVRLNVMGKRAVERFLRHRKNLPSYVTFDENLKRWAAWANLNDEGISIKSTRKTWESYLVVTYKNNREEIYLSQGHSMQTALDFYLGLDFDEEDKKEMKYYVDGWI